jgi:hypothetical protein
MVFDNTTPKRVTVQYGSQPLYIAQQVEYNYYKATIHYDSTPPTTTISVERAVPDQDIFSTALCINSSIPSSTIFADTDEKVTDTFTYVMRPVDDVLYTWTVEANAAKGFTTDYTLAITFVYAIGDTGPGGGKIFYIDDGTYGGGTWTYLEAAPADIAAGTLAWASSAYQTTQIGNTATGIGTGQANTATILGIDAIAPAALECVNYNFGGCTDWFLPSYYEMEAMYINKIAIGGLSTTLLYWSSSENDGGNAWYQDFDTNTNSSNSVKSNLYLVRAIRAF